MQTYELFCSFSIFAAMARDIKRELERRILLLDGGLGTMIQALGLGESDYRGREFLGWKCPLAGCMDLLCLTAPRKIAAIHRAYLEAGADIITTNSFNANSISLLEYGLEGYVYRIARAAAAIAREAADGFSSDGRPRFVAGSMGPTSKTASIAASVGDSAARDVTFAKLADTYFEQASGLIDGGADVLLLETVFDTLNAKAAIFAIDRLCSERGSRIPLMISVTVSQKAGRTLSGQTIEAFWTSVRHARPLSVGINCSFGAREMLPHLERLAAVADTRISVHPNAGLPNISGGYDETPESWAAAMRPYAERGLVNIMGGCCGTTPDFIRAIAPLAAAFPPRPLPKPDTDTVVSGLDTLRIVPEANFINAGERCNVAGSAKFARLIREGNYDEAIGVARAQVAAGAQIVDICMDDGLIDGPAAMRTFVNMIAGEVDIARVPLMIDSSDFETIVAGLECCQGKPVVNSISLKEGPEEFLRRAALIRAYGAAAVVMLFDEQGQATSFERKTAVAARAYNLLVSNGFDPQDIIFDPNILAVATGIAEHDGYALAFIDATRWIKENLPHAKVSGGVSNLSFAFRGNNTVREAMHSAFLYHARRAGMDMGIVNPQMLKMYDDIPAELLERVEDVLLCRRSDASERLAEYAAAIKERELAAKAASDGGTGGVGGGPGGSGNVIPVADNSVIPGAGGNVIPSASGNVIPGAAEGSPGRGSAQSWRSAPAGERIGYAMLHGIPDHIAEDCMEAMAQLGSPLEVINKLMMPAMERVGVLFGDGKMFLPQVVKTATVMKQGVAALQPYISRGGQTADTKADTQNACTPEGCKHITQTAESQGDTLHASPRTSTAVATDSHAYPRVVVATVKGDIHDIGKNIVSVVMACNGCEIIDLGVMVEPSAIIEAVRTHNADFICLSGLITPSLAEMINVCRHLKEAGITIPVIVGGATTSPMHTAVKIAPEYGGIVVHSPDASRNSQIISNLQSPLARVHIARILADQKHLRDLYETARASRDLVDFRERRAAAVAARGAQPPDSQPIPTSRLRNNTQAKSDKTLKDRVIDTTGEVRYFQNYDIATVAEHIDWDYFLAEWGAKGSCDEIQLISDAKKMLEDLKNGNILNLQGAVGHFCAGFDKNSPDDIILDGHRFPMLRNQTRCDENRALSDYVAAAGEVIVFAISAGVGLKEYCDRLNAAGDQYGAFMAKVLTDRLTEALAQEVVPAKEGERHAFGYPSCPDHSLKEVAFDLLGIEGNCDFRLTSSYMIDPAESLCGMVIPGAGYFTVGKISDDQLADYAARRGLPVEELKKILIKNL